MSVELKIAAAEIVEVPEPILALMDNLKDKAGQQVELPEITRPNYDRLVEFANLFLAKTKAEQIALAEPQKWGDASPERAWFDEYFRDIQLREVTTLSVAANSVGFKEFMYIVFARLAQMIQSMGPDEIRGQFALKDDLSEEEKRKIEEETHLGD
jgi:Skp1 family, dimerisation domain